ncbi:MAG: ATP-binding protein [Pseudomonadota bacterium]
MDGAGPTVSLVRQIGGTLTSVAETAAEAEEFCAAAGADKGQCLRIGLALDELAANALVHGAVNEQAPDIQAEIWVDQTCLHLRVSARGPRFDPRQFRMDADAEQYSMGGRGLALVIAFADELVYAREDGRNVTTFSVTKQGEEDG